MANTTPQLIGTHVVTTKDAAAPAYNSANEPIKNVRRDKYFTVSVLVSGGADTIRIVGYTCSKDSIAPANEFGLGGTLTVANDGVTDFSRSYSFFSDYDDIGFLVDDGAGGNITPTCTIKVRSSSDKG